MTQTAELTPADLLASARDLIVRPDVAVAGVWPRTAAVLARQALEAAVDAHWRADARTVEMTRATMRSQLICLPAFLDGQLARQVAFAYAALTNACHYHPFELAPTAAELIGWITDVEAIVAQLGASSSAPAGS
jgi:hypothetical protein